MQENQEAPQEQSDKISKQFDAQFKKLIALMGGEANLKKPSIPNDTVGNLVEELIKERREEIVVRFKTDAKALLDKKIEFDKECRKAEQEYKNKVIQKKKEFVDEMQKVFASIENIAEIEKSYYSSVQLAAQ